ncbi:MAG: transcriptional regulator [Caldilineaceae bacterium]|nr:transcriptional regulator [Caldilineaceae bacterium]
MRNTPNTKNDEAWEKLFKKYCIVDQVAENGQATISSQQINEFREARLMTKFDHSINLPRLFQDNQLAILPRTRGEYVIAKMNAYYEIQNLQDDGIIYMDFPEHLQSLDYEKISSEASALNCAYISGILSDFLEDYELLPTVNGRMSSGSFDFTISKISGGNPLRLSVANSQVEIDGGFEGINYLSIIEAKNYMVSDFLIRQLYYPFRLWKDRIAKKVKPVFCVYSNGVFHLYEYQFCESSHYNSIHLIKQKRYSLEKKNISLNDIYEIWQTTFPIEEPKVSFPQADSFERVINLCELLFEENELSKEIVTTTYDFDVRQTGYYTDAGIYLGLIAKVNEDGIKYCLTEEGRKLFDKKYRERQLGFARAILKHSVFSKVLDLYLRKAELPSHIEIIGIMKDSGLYRVAADSTYRRRASTILSWLNWILDLQDD